MHCENDVVVYGASGACRIVGVCESPFDRNDKRPYYVLSPFLSTDHSTIYAPVELVEGKARHIISRGEAEVLLRSFNDALLLVPPTEKMRRDLYRQTLVQAEPFGYVSILKTVAKRRTDAALAKRQLAGVDAEFEQRARAYLSLELSMALGEQADVLARRVTLLAAESVM